MITANTTALDWVSAGNSTSVDALVLRFGAVLNGLLERVLDNGSDWFLVDRSGRLIDCRADDLGASGLIGAPLAKIAGGAAAESIEQAWRHVLNGRAQAVWPWQGGRARVAMRSIELHPIRDVLTDEDFIVGALVVIVDADARGESLSAAA
ncbi:hypothetical protein [Microcella sp.]|uniref:hypothetical protein n=1 Tax=Microcella sp. TaxID=1913979 RepID=UPI0025650595|nr:hypothetical protein [Microcella sp.]MBX9472897.1 hypothetical protein [Microcella sp.]